VKSNTQTSLQGQGSTSRGTTLTTTLSARVTDVLPNGYLVVEGVKRVQVNSENQIITIRGVVRPFDLDLTNSVASDRIAQMEVQVNGKGVVGDSIHRPFFLYRILLGLLPF
jgi:flagellar L-ring protein precursor FlgH